MLCNCGQSWWLWLTLVFISVSMVICADCTERHHHNHNHHHHHHNHHLKHATRHTTQSDALSSPQLEKIPSLPLADMAEPGDSCPNCVLPEQKRDKAQSSDEIRLETIKRQILSKLGLKEKPNVTSPVPREVILETLNRADEMLEQPDGSGNHNIMYEDDSAVPSSTRPPESEPDDFYGRTSEIIAFAEPGTNATCPASQGTQCVPLETPFIYVVFHLMLCNTLSLTVFWVLCYTLTRTCFIGRGNSYSMFCQF